jgi:hypothetical protein
MAFRRILLRFVQVLILLISIPLLVFFGWEFARRFNLPYENERYFDETSSVVYKQQTLELYAFIIITLALFVILSILWIIKTKR